MPANLRGEFGSPPKNFRVRQLDARAERGLGHLSRHESWPPRGKGLNCFREKLNYEVASSVRAKYVVLSAQILLTIWQIGLAITAIASFHKKSSDLQQILHGHMF